jgi:hypothetical protein
VTFGLHIRVFISPLCKVLPHLPLCCLVKTLSCLKYMASIPHYPTDACSAYQKVER